MITVKVLSDGKVTEVRGSESEVMLFYCFWQSSIWPDWMQYEKMGVENDHATRQHKQVIESVNAGRCLSLYSVGKEFKTAVSFAVDRCVRLGIEVST